MNELYLKNRSKEKLKRTPTKTVEQNYVTRLKEKQN